MLITRRASQQRSGAGKKVKVNLDAFVVLDRAADPVLEDRVIVFDQFPLLVHGVHPTAQHPQGFSQCYNYNWDKKNCADLAPGTISLSSTFAVPGTRNLTKNPRTIPRARNLYPLFDAEPRAFGSILQHWHLQVLFEGICRLKSTQE